MKMRYIGICVLICVLASNLVHGQRAEKLEIAAEQISELKNGTLLIKLNTQSVRIQHRLKSGQKKKAQKLIDEIEKEQNEIIQAFKEHYTFSDYYFFYSDSSHAVIVEQDYSLLFKEKNVKLDSIDSIDNPFILVLGIPPGYSTVDSYKFILHASDKEGIKPVSKFMPRVFGTQKKWTLFAKYDFDRSVKGIQNRLDFYHDEFLSDL